MTEADYQIALEKYLAGSLADQEMEQFLAATRCDGKRLKTLGDALLNQSLLFEYYASTKTNPDSTDLADSKCINPARLRRMRIQKPRIENRFLWQGSVVAAMLLLSLGIWLWNKPSKKNIPPTVEIVTEARTDLRINEHTIAQHGAIYLYPGDRLTSGKAANFKGIYADGSLFLVEGPVDLMVMQTINKQIELLKGSITAEVVPQPAGKPFSIATPQTSVSVLGTRFNVSTNTETSWVKVDSGQVEVTTTGNDKSMKLSSNERATIAQEIHKFLVAAEPRTILDFESKQQSRWLVGKTPSAKLTYRIAPDSYKGNGLMIDSDVPQGERATNWAWVTADNWFGEQDWSAYSGIAFWYKGPRGFTVRIDLLLGERRKDPQTYSVFFESKADEWQLYKFPWSAFHWLWQENQKPKGLDLRKIFSLAFVTGTGKATIQIDDISLYP